MLKQDLALVLRWVGLGLIGVHILLKWTSFGSSLDESILKAIFSAGALTVAAGNWFRYRAYRREERADANRFLASSFLLVGLSSLPWVLG